MSPELVYLYDANPIDLRDRRTRLQEQLGEAGALAEWQICATASRNALLASVYGDAARRPRRQSVTLIDLRGETGDLEQRGFSVCQTIVHHRSLRIVTRPLIWTDVHTAANLQYARSVGALGVIDDEWVDGGFDAPLAQVLAWAKDQPSPSGTALTTPRVFPPDHSSVDAEERERLQRFARWFGYIPTEPDLDFALLWGMAEAVELKFLMTSVTEAGLSPSERATRRELEKLQKAMSPDVDAFDGPEPARAEIARRFLAEMAPPEPTRVAELAWPKPERIRELLATRPDVVTWAYLSPDDLDTLTRFMHLYKGSFGGVDQRHQAIQAAVETVAAGVGRPHAGISEQIRRSACAVEDAFFDWRDHGEPEPLS